MLKFARVVFFGAGVWGVVVLTPLYFLFDATGRAYPPPTSYPHFFYGFLSVALAWQFAFFVIAFDPARFRPMMLLGLVEKGSFVIGTTALYLHGAIPAVDAQSAIPDSVLLVLFAIAFWRTPTADAGRWR